MSSGKTGYYYEVTEEQVAQHKRRSLVEILKWLHDTNIFINSVRTDEEKLIAKKLKAKNYFIITNNE